MSGSQIYTGRWVDHSSNVVLGGTLTLTAVHGAQLLAGIAILVTIAGERAWTIASIAIHQWRARPQERDPFHLQQQVTLRNNGSALGTSITLAKIGYAWRHHKQYHPKRRSASLFLFALFVWVSFFVAGIFSSNVATDSFKANTVLKKSTNCGFVTKSTNNFAQDFGWDPKIKNDTRAARVYSSNCYGTRSDELACAGLPVQYLNYTVDTAAACPFPGTGRCVTGDLGAYALDTNFLDSHINLGINAKRSDRVQFRKRLTCSVIHLNVGNEVTFVNDSLTNNVTSILEIYMGPIKGVSPYTYNYPWRLAYRPYTPYIITSVYAGPNFSIGYSPTSNFSRSDADVSFHFFNANTVRYLGPNEDPFFNATELWDGDGDPTLANIYYEPAHWVSTMGCAEQYQFRNPNTNKTTILTGFNATGFPLLGYNDAQFAAVSRIWVYLYASSIYNVVAGQQGDALQASDLIFGSIGPAIPEGQWQLEVRRWFETGLAMLQQATVDYPSNSWATNHVGQPVVAPVTEIDLVAQCSQQRVRNVGSYQNFSILGISIICFVSSILIIVSLLLDWLILRLPARQWGGDKFYKTEAHNADGTLQLLRMALEWAGRGEWEPTLKDVPVLSSRMPPLKIPRATQMGFNDPVRYPAADSEMQNRSGTNLPLQGPSAPPTRTPPARGPPVINLRAQAPPVQAPPNGAQAGARPVAQNLAVPGVGLPHPYVRQPSYQQAGQRTPSDAGSETPDTASLRPSLAPSGHSDAPSHATSSSVAPLLGEQGEA